MRSAYKHSQSSKKSCTQKLLDSVFQQTLLTHLKRKKSKNELALFDETLQVWLENNALPLWKLYSTHAIIDLPL